MPGYETHIRTLRFGGDDYRIRSLIDVQQFADPDLVAEGAGVSPSQWSLFGHPWPSGRLLAQSMSGFDFTGKRILEIGCGLGLASLVLRRRGADILASDHHPLAEVFLAYNAGLNDIPAVPYRALRWDSVHPTLGRFDAIIGSDILYERGHAGLLAGMVARHAQPNSEILIADPGRGNGGALNRELAQQGYLMSESRPRLDDAHPAAFNGRLYRYARSGPVEACA